VIDPYRGAGRAALTQPAAAATSLHQVNGY